MLIMIEYYIPIFIVLAIGVVFAVATVMSSVIFGPQRPNREKLSTYESGMKPVGSTHERVSVKYYLVAMFFIIFDLEVIFVYPWAIQFKRLFNEIGSAVFFSMLIFLILPFAAGGYEYHLLFFKTKKTNVGYSKLCRH